jgi:type I restriction enzyme M protein
MNQENTSAIISKVWGMCNPLRDDGVSYGDYLEQLTYLIFLKMSDEYSKPPYNKETNIPAGYTWADMNTLKGAELEQQYKATLEKLGEQGGILGKIFKGATNKIRNAAILYRIVQMIDNEKWVSMSSDVKGEIYEGLLQKNAEDVKSGAGQYFTPRPLIRAMVKCLRPEPMKTIADPCCGSGGFFLAAHEYIANNYSLDREQKEFLKNSTFYGNELVDSTFKLCLMNLYLHNIGDIYGNVPVTLGDALLSDPGIRVDYVMTNPPFGKSRPLLLQMRKENRRKKISYITDRIFGQPHPISNLILYSISTQSSNPPERPPLSFRIMCCLRAEPGKLSGRNCCKPLIYTQS